MSPTTITPRYLPETPFERLTTSELLVMTTLRLWALPHRAPEQSHPDWRGGLSAAGLGGDAVDSFDLLLRMVVCTTMRPLDVRCPGCPGLGLDEGIFLQALSHLQQRREASAANLLADWMPPAAVRLAMPHARTLARLLLDRGLLLDRHRNAAPPAPALLACADPGLTLLH